MKVEHSQQSFIGGVLSPRLYGREGTEFYNAALASCLNWEVTPQGSLVRRAGSVFGADLGDDARARLVTFPQTSGQDYLILLTDLKMRLYTIDGALPFAAGGSGLDFLINGDFAFGGESWTLKGVTAGRSQVDFINGDCRLQGSRSGDDIWRPSIVQEFVASNTVAATLKIAWKAVSGRIKGANVSVTQGSTTVARWDKYTSPGSVTELAVNLEAGKTYQIRIRVDTPPRSLGWSYGLPGGSKGKGADGPFSLTLDYVSLVAGSGGGSPVYEFTTPWTAEQLADVKWAVEPGRNRAYFVHPGAQPQVLSRNRTTGAWLWAPASFTNPPAEWTGTNWPSVVEYYQSRLWLASTPNEPTTLWASRTGNPLDFTASTGDQVLETDMIKIPAATKGAITWLLGRQVLLFGTELGEHSITSSNGMLTPADFQVKQESAFGSAAIMAVDLGDQVLFCSRDYRKVRGIDFNLQTQAWTAHDLTYAAEHVTQQLVGEVHYARDPHSTLVILRRDGTLACCTFDREAKVVAWWEADLGGHVSTATVSSGPQGSVIYAVVQRDTGVFLEHLACNEFHADRLYLDAAVRRVTDDDTLIEWDAESSWSLGAVRAWNGKGYVASSAVNIPAVGVPPDVVGSGWSVLQASGVDVVVSVAKLANGTPVLYGLDHLEGLTVEVILDGAREPTGVVSGGRMALTRPGETVVVGLPFTATAVTLPPATPNGRGGLSTLRSRRRWVKLYVRLNQSALPKMNGDRVPRDRSIDTAMDQPDVLWTGDFGGPVSADWETRGAVTLEADMPFRTEVQAVFGSLDEGEV